MVPSPAPVPTTKAAFASSPARARDRRLTLALDEMPAGITRQQIAAYAIRSLTDSENPPGTDFERAHFYDRQHHPDYYGYKASPAAR